MASIYDVPIDKLLLVVKEELKSVDVIKAPSWAVFVKTGMHNERPPTQPDWWHMRAASILRKLALIGPIGVSKLRRYYGGKKNRGNKPEHFFKGSGNIIRKVLQQLDKAGLSKQIEIKGHKGRVLTPKGVSMLDKAATKVQHSMPKKGKQIEMPKTVEVEQAKAEPTVQPTIENTQTAESNEKSNLENKELVTEQKEEVKQ